ncbi:384_t:CDS:2, partial [Scutellospora calospora]
RFLMPYCIDTIIKIIQVRLTEKDELNFTIVWALGVYPVESEDREMEVTLFVPVNEDERDPNTQSVFVKSEYYSVCGKVVTGTYNGKFRLKMIAMLSTHFTLKRDLGSNRCLLKALLVSVAQDLPKEIDSENAMFELSVNDYNESVLFVVRHLEVIQQDLYIYTADTSFVKVCSAVKRKFSSSSDSQTTSGEYRSVRSRLLTAHQNVIKKLPQVSSVEANKCLVDSATNGPYSTHIRVEDTEDKDLYVERYEEHVDNHNGHESSIMNKSKKIVHGCGKRDKGKEKITQPVVHNTRSQTEMFKDTNDE